MTEVRRLRTERGMTSQALADAARVSIATIRRMEQSSGKRKGSINITSACLVARALGVEVDKVFPDTELTEVGRSAQTGGNYNTKPIQIVRICPNPCCKMQVPNGVPADGTCEYCDASLAAA